MNLVQGPSSEVQHRKQQLELHRRLQIHKTGLDFGQQLRAQKRCDLPAAPDAQRVAGSSGGRRRWRLDFRLQPVRNVLVLGQRQTGHCLVGKLNHFEKYSVLFKITYIPYVHKLGNIEQWSGLARPGFLGLWVIGVFWGFLGPFF